MQSRYSAAAALLFAGSAAAQNESVEPHIAAARAAAGEHSAMADRLCPKPTTYPTVAHEGALAALATLE